MTRIGPVIIRLLLPFPYPYPPSLCRGRCSRSDTGPSPSAGAGRRVAPARALAGAPGIGRGVVSSYNVDYFMDAGGVLVGRGAFSRPRGAAGAGSSRLSMARRRNSSPRSAIVCFPASGGPSPRVGRAFSPALSSSGCTRREAVQTGGRGGATPAPAQGGAPRPTPCAARPGWGDAALARPRADGVRSRAGPGGAPGGRSTSRPRARRPYPRPGR